MTTPYVPQKATLYVRQKQESFSDESIATFDETDWDSIRSNVSQLNVSCQARGCLKIRSFEESLKCSYAVTPRSTTTKDVRWSSVDVHLHTFELGDHPCPIMGPPTTISWVAHDHKSLLIDDYENKRRKQKRDTICPTIREHILLNAGCSKKELGRAINEARSVRMSRARSQNDKFREKSKKPLFSWLTRGKSVKTVETSFPVTAFRSHAR